MKKLKLALIHLAVGHKQPRQNRQMLVELAEQAARQGADLIVAPELSISGYSFESRKDMIPQAETTNGPTLTALAAVARRFCVYVCVGLAEKDALTGILYNSAFVLGPDGRPVCRYRKINAESRWACPGDPRQDNTFETPWGRVGVLICSDSYHGLMPRVTALRGADLLLVPANWPPVGLDPLEMWRARALENGFYLAGCNRTGIDLHMDCQEAPSAVCDPEGQMLFEGRHHDSQLFMVELPLTAAGRLANLTRQKRLADRRPQIYHGCYLNLKMITDLTSFLALPKPGKLNLNCLVPGIGEHPVDSLKNDLAESVHGPDRLYLLPPFAYSDEALKKLEAMARKAATTIITCRPNNDGQDYAAFLGNGRQRRWHLPSWPFDDDAALAPLDCGPARLFTVPFAALIHPELGVALAKKGADLALALEEWLSPAQRLLAGVRTIENLALTVCAKNGAGIWNTPEGHARWDEQGAEPGQACRYNLNTHRTRLKKFQDRIDFEVLLRQTPIPQ